MNKKFVARLTLGQVTLVINNLRLFLMTRVDVNLLFVPSHYAFIDHKFASKLSINYR